MGWFSSISTGVNRRAALGPMQGLWVEMGPGKINPQSWVSYQRAIDYGVHEYFMADLQQEINPATSWRIASLSLVKVDGPGWLCYVSAATSHFLLLGALYRTANWMFMTPCVPRCHIIYSQIESCSVWNCYYFRRDTARRHENAQVISCFTCEKVIPEVNRSKLNLRTQSLSNEAWTMQ